MPSKVSAPNGRAHDYDLHVRELLALQEGSIQPRLHHRTSASDGGHPQGTETAGAEVWSVGNGGQPQEPDRLFHRCAQACASVARDFYGLHREGIAALARLAVVFGFRPCDAVLLVAVAFVATASLLI